MGRSSRRKRKPPRCRGRFLTGLSFLLARRHRRRRTTDNSPPLKKRSPWAPPCVSRRRHTNDGPFCKRSRPHSLLNHSVPRTTAVSAVRETSPFANFGTADTAVAHFSQQAGQRSQGGGQAPFSAGSGLRHKGRDGRKWCLTLKPPLKPPRSFRAKVVRPANGYVRFSPATRQTQSWHTFSRHGRRFVRPGMSAVES